LDDVHNINLDSIQTYLEESAGESIRARGLVASHLVNSLLDLLLGKRFPKAIQIRCGEVQALPIEIKGAGLHRTHSLKEMVVDDLLLGLMLRNPTVVVMEPKNVVLSPPRIDPHMKILSVSITFLDVGNAGTLSFPRPFYHREGKDLSFQPFAKVDLIGGKEMVLLGQVKMKDNKKGRMNQNLCVREATPSPFGKHATGVPQFVEENMARFGVRGWLVPSVLHQFTEPGQPHPKVLKLERTRPPGPAIIGKEERAMVRQRGREGM
jgi:hypothetical protein